MMKSLRFFAVLLGLFAALGAHAQGNLEVNTPAITQIKKSMAQRHPQLWPHYESGAVGVARDGGVFLRDPSLIPLAQRQVVAGLVAAENADRTALYREIARANGNPAWEQDIRATFGQRWIDRAPTGWWVQSATGAWQQKR